MTRLADFARHKDELKRQLLRRIGYTGGLFDLFRFARVIDQVQPRLPMAQDALAGEVARVEGISFKYSSDMLDVLRAFRLIEQAGPRITLTTTGRALHALCKLNLDSALKPLFLVLVIDRDGDYSLNLFKQLKDSADDSQAFCDRILSVLEIRRAELERVVGDKFTADVVDRYLDDLRESILQISGRRSAKPMGFRQRVEAAQRQRRPGRAAKRTSSELTGEPTNTLRHTIMPRRTWLQTLDLVDLKGKRGPTLSAAGTRLWTNLVRLGFVQEEVVRVPYDEELIGALALAGLLPSLNRDDLFGVASLTYSARADADGLAPRDFLEAGREIHEFTRLSHFPQSDADSIYVTLASKLAAEGRVLTKERFSQLVQEASSMYPESLYRLSRRRGGFGYLRFK